MKNKYTFNTIIIILIILFAIFYIFLISKTSKELAVFDRWLSETLEIKILNEEIDVQLSKQLDIQNYDSLNNKITKINHLINDIANKNNLESFFIKTKNRKLFDKIKSSFAKKRDIIDNFNTVKSLNINSILFMNENLTKTKNIYENSDIYTKLMLGKIKMNLDTKNLINEIDSYMTDILDKNSIDYIFLKRAKIVVNNMNTFINLYKENNSLNLDNDMDEFIKRINKHFSDTLYSLYSPIMLSVIILLLSIARNIYVGKRSKKYAADLMQVDKLIYNSPDSICKIDKNGNIIYVNSSFERISGYKSSELVGKKLSYLKIDDDIYDSMLTTIRNKSIWQYDDFLSKTKNGILIYEKAIAVPTLDESFEVDGAIVLKKDITKERLITKELNFRIQEIRNNSLTDRLTGLGNQTSLMERMDNKKYGIIIYINLNHFSNLRFFYKNSTVDLILVTVAETLKLCVDTYKMNANIYRIQIDEFCIWYEGKNIQKDVKYIAEYFNAKNIDIIGDSSEIIQNIGATIGVSLNFDTPNTNRLTQAILAHQEAKQKELSVVFYKINNAVEQQYYKNQTVIRLIKYALTESKVILECQPIFDIKTNAVPSISYYEVLVRIIGEDNKIHYPGEFLDIAKQTSLYIAITKQVVNQTFDLIENFSDKRFSMNLSSVDMVNESAKKLFMQKLISCSKPSNLTIEVLESESIDDYAEINPFIESVKNLGCKIAIDDFGSGYSNYYRMLEINIDILKIDGSIIKKIPFDKNARNVVETIVQFANRQGYDLVAEFVSTAEILEYVKGYGIKYAQGFLLGKPIHPSNID